MFLKLCAISLPIFQPVLSATYTLSRSWSGEAFYNDFEWQTFDDPTHGRVNYVDQDTAKAQNLSWAGDGLFVMRADASKVVDPSARGRDSVRIHSKDLYGDGVLVVDVSHMPVGCAAWPAVWTCTPGSWPTGGEVDIIEGIYGIRSGYSNNLFSLHTDPGCMMPQSPPGQNRTDRGSGVALQPDCRGNVGCGVKDDSGKSFGRDFNQNGGGVFVMRRSMTRGFSMWFWPHNSGHLPSDVAGGSQIIMESLWSQPIANFQPDNCDFAKYFDKHEIIINLTFGGDWAGRDELWQASGCPGDLKWTINDFVDKNPGEFFEAFWEIRAMRWYDEVPAGGKRCARRAN
ncbi:hypothetical protein IAT40_000792 [Kwoniella sp. CBS 6097]